MNNSTQRPLYLPYAGPSLLEMPLLNKGSAFTLEERIAFNLIGLLPQNVESIEEQAERAYRQYQHCHTDLQRHITLRAIQDDNETLFFRLLYEHLEEMLPIVYTPTVGKACEEFSNIYRNHRGLFISYPDREHMDDMLRSATKDNVKVIVITDGERILGLGDQGIGGMGIPIGKLSLYTACGGISPAYTLPMVLDTGTNNQNLIDDPMYMGWRHERIDQELYDAFVDDFIAVVKRRWPRALVQFEDFAQHNAMRLLERYRDQICCFNDDIQGTAAVAVATTLAACRGRDQSIAEQRVVIVGAGSAGCGIGEHLVVAMRRAGLGEQQARRQIYMIGRHGLVTTEQDNLSPEKARLAQDAGAVRDWPGTDLLSVVSHAGPTVLIGVSGQPDLFSEDVIRAVHANCERPLIMPLSNPTSRVEATPADILEWTDGQALVATGSPFPPVVLGGERYPIAQCNNVYVFPGIGLGVIAADASRITDAMLVAASEALAGEAPVVRDNEGALLPPLAEIRDTSKRIAFAVARQAQADGVALRCGEETTRRAVERNAWLPAYRTYRRRAF